MLFCLEDKNYNIVMPLKIRIETPSITMIVF